MEGWHLLQMTGWSKFNNRRLPRLTARNDSKKNYTVEKYFTVKKKNNNRQTPA